MAWVDYSDIIKKESKIPAQTAQVEKVVTSKQEVDPNVAKAIEKFRLWMQHKRYSSNTIDTYCDSIKIFIQFLFPKKMEEIDERDMVRFVNEFIIKKGLSFSYQNQIVNAAKLFFREVLKTRLDVEKFERPRRQHKLPNVLSKEEVKKILEAPGNLKHRTMLSLIYACGLRRSELLNLKTEMWIPSEIC